MKQLFALTLIGVATLLASGEYSNRRAPSFSLPDATMKQHDILDYRGKVLLIDFMQTKCEKCQAFTKMIEAKVKQKYGDKVEVLSVVVPPDTIDDVKKYIGVFKVTGPILFDSGQVAGSYVKATPQKPAFYFPHVFLIDQNGQIRNDWQWTAPGAYPEVLSGEKLMAEIDKLLGAAPAAPAAKTPAKK